MKSPKRRQTSIHACLPAFWIISILLAAGCQKTALGEIPTLAAPASTITTRPYTPTTTLTLPPMPSTTATISAPKLTPSPTEPPGCEKPSDDYTQVSINGFSLNQRTLSMLEHANDLYGGEIDITGWAITQGSYTGAVAASFGTHSGGGAVDLAVMRTGTWTVVTEEIEPLVRALRLAGFAAWLRLPDEVEPGSGIHIHAIAIGDEDLSLAAQEQLTGEYGYFRGYNGLPEDRSHDIDRHGGPILCRWMIEYGYADLRPVPERARNIPLD